MVLGVLDRLLWTGRLAVTSDYSLVVERHYYYKKYLKLLSKRDLGMLIMILLILKPLSLTLIYAIIIQTNYQGVRNGKECEKTDIYQS